VRYLELTIKLIVGFTFIINISGWMHWYVSTVTLVVLCDLQCTGQLYRLLAGYCAFIDHVQPRGAK